MSVKTITMTACNRPHYLVRALDALSKTNLAGYTLFLGVDPGNAEVERLCRGIRFVESNVVLHGQRLGTNRNTFEVLQRAFDSGSQFNVHIEEDVLLSPDALDLSNWFFSLSNRDDYEGLGLDYDDLLDLFPAPRDVVLDQLLVRKPMFCGRGFCITKTKWNERVRSLVLRSITKPIFPWDMWIYIGLQKKPGARVLVPALSRMAHIGVRSDANPGWDGMYDLILKHHHYYKGPGGIQYRIEPTRGEWKFFERHWKLIQWRLMRRQEAS